MQQSVRALSKRLHPTAIDKEIHWRNLDWEKKQFAAEECAKLDFRWYAVVAYKPALAQVLPPPKLYNYCTRMLLERLCLTAKSENCDLIPVFSNRSRTNYRTLQNYVSTEVTAFGTATCLRPIRTQQPNKERLLQLVDVCAGTLHNALEVNNFGKLQTTFLASTAKRLGRPQGRMWGRSLKFFPAEAGTNYGPATTWIDAARNK